MRGQKLFSRIVRQVLRPIVASEIAVGPTELNYYVFVHERCDKTKDTSSLFTRHFHAKKNVSASKIIVLEVVSESKSEHAFPIRLLTPPAL